MSLVSLKLNLLASGCLMWCALTVAAQTPQGGDPTTAASGTSSNEPESNEPGQAVTASQGRADNPSDDQASAEKPAGKKQADKKTIEALIKQLDADTFVDREHATLELFEIGAPALPLLREVDEGSFELRHRAKSLADRIESDRFLSLSRSFLLDTDASHSYGLPGWATFAQRAGGSRTSKLLFLQMLECQPELSRLFAQNDLPLEDEALKGFLDKVRRESAVEAYRLGQEGLRSIMPEIGDLAAMLIASSLVDGQSPIEVNQLICDSSHITPVTSFMNRRGYGRVLRRLYDHWVTKTHPAMANEVMHISLTYGLESGAVVARTQLAENIDAATREKAIQCLARFGERSDVPRLLALFEDRTICDKFSDRAFHTFRRDFDESNEPPPGIPGGPLNAEGWVVRINDLAFAAALLLSDQGDSGLIPELQRVERSQFETRSVAVRRGEEEMRRDEAMQGWKRVFQANTSGF